MSTVVTNIQITSHDTVSFYEDSDVVMNVSQVVDGTSLYILRSGLNIIILNKTTGTPIPLQGGGNSNDHFVFSTIPIITIGSRTYTPVDQASTTSGAKNLERAKDIYTYLVNNIFKGCCDCTGDTTCAIQYIYDVGTEGSWTYSSGVLMMSLTSSNGIDFSGLFHRFPDGSWISFFQDSDPGNYSIFEISNYTTVSGFAIWDAVLVDGQSTYVGNPTFCTSYQPALSSGGGGSQGFQQVLDVDSLLDKDNTVDGGGFDFDWTNFAEYDIGVSSFFRALAGAGGYFSRVYVDPTTGSFDVSGTGTQSAKVSASNSGGVPNVTLRATDGVTETTEIILLEDGMFMVTPDVNSGTAVNGMSILLSDNTNGRIEFGTPSGIGTTATAPSDVADSSANVLRNLTGCSVPIVAGNTYYFMAFGSYDANSTAIGSRWTVNGPAATYLAYSSNYSLSATSATNNQGLSAYQLPSSNNSTSAATSGNTFKIEGIIIPSANGSLQVQFACESALGTITAKAGSFLKVIQL